MKTNPLNELLNLIENGNEYAVINAFSKLGYVNFPSEDGNHVVFSLVKTEMYRAVDMVISNPSFNGSECHDVFGGLLQTLMYNYAAKNTSKENKEIIRQLIDKLLAMDDCGVNIVNPINGSTALHSACEFEEFTWVFDKLMERDDVDINIVDEYGDTPWLAAIMSDTSVHYLEALGKRQDLILHRRDVNMMRNLGLGWHKDEWHYFKFIHYEPIKE